MPPSHTPPQPAAGASQEAVLEYLAHLTAPTPEKLTWLVEQYTQLRPEGQAAIDLCLIALVPHRPGSTTSQA
jgi:hypothetical protein